MWSGFLGVGWGVVVGQICAQRNSITLWQRQRGTCGCGPWGGQVGGWPERVPCQCSLCTVGNR